MERNASSVRVLSSFIHRERHDVATHDASALMWVMQMGAFLLVHLHHAIDTLRGPPQALAYPKVVKALDKRWAGVGFRVLLFSH